MTLERLNTLGNPKTEDRVAWIIERSIGLWPTLISRHKRADEVPSLMGLLVESGDCHLLLVVHRDEISEPDSSVREAELLLVERGEVTEAYTVIGPNILEEFADIKEEQIRDRVVTELHELSKMSPTGFFRILVMFDGTEGTFFYRMRIQLGTGALA